MSNTIVTPKNRRRCTRACENCRRRKERCNGLQPCQRCRMRSVDSECHFAQTAPTVRVTTNGRRMKTDALSPSHIILSDSSASTVLQNVRVIVRASIGECDFTESILDPIRNPPSETWSTRFPGDQPRIHPTIGPSEALRLAKCFLYSTAGVLDLFNVEDLHAQLAVWMAKSRKVSDLNSAVFYLVLAIGAQTGPSDLDSVAEQYYDHGRYSGLHGASREISYASLQYFILVTTYLMGESLMDAAFIQLGSAARAAFVLGLHRRVHPTTITSSESQMRERLWRSVRVLDLVLSIMLGRPPATAHYRDAALETNYSATVDICNVLEAVLTEVYAKDVLCNDTVQDIISQHRAIVSQLTNGLKNDGLGCSNHIEDIRLDLGVCHVKYGSCAIIQLLTMPFLIARVSQSHSGTAGSLIVSPELDKTSQGSLSPQSMAFACVDSAISLVELFRKLTSGDQTPKRLPIVVYAMFYASLSLGLAVFGDLDLIFPLEETIRVASELLVKFGKYDWLAERYAIVIAQLQAVCRLYVQRRSEALSCEHRARVRELFGSLDVRTSTGDENHTSELADDVSLPSTRESHSTRAATRLNQPVFHTDRPSRSHTSDGEVDRQSDSCAEELMPLTIDGGEFWVMQDWDRNWLNQHIDGDMFYSPLNAL